MILPSTMWMMAAAVCALALSAAAGVFLKMQRGRNDEIRRKEAIRAHSDAIEELYVAVIAGDANRVRRAGKRLHGAKVALARYRAG